MTTQLNPLIRLTSGRLTVFQQQWALLQKQYALKNISEDLFTGEKRILPPWATELQAFLTQIQQNQEQLQKAYNRSIQSSLTACEPLPHDPATISRKCRLKTTRKRRRNRQRLTTSERVRDC